jgi:hypothetical protein
MATTPPPDPGAPGDPAAPATKGGLAAWFKKQGKTTWYVGGAGIVVAIALYVKSRKSAAGTSTSASTATPDSTVLPTSEFTGTDGGGGDFGGDLSGLETSIAGLQTSIAGLQPGTGGTSTAPAPGSAGTLGTPITENVANTVQADLSEGETVDYLSAPGAAPVQVTQPTPGGGWDFGGSSVAPGNPTGAPGAPSEYFTPNAAPLAGSAPAQAPNVVLS